MEIGSHIDPLMNLTIAHGLVFVSALKGNMGWAWGEKDEGAQWRFQDRLWPLIGEAFRSDDLYRPIEVELYFEGYWR